MMIFYPTLSHSEKLRECYKSRREWNDELKFNTHGIAQYAKRALELIDAEIARLESISTPLPQKENQE